MALDHPCRKKPFLYETEATSAAQSLFSVKQELTATLEEFARAEAENDAEIGSSSNSSESSNEEEELLPAKSLPRSTRRPSVSVPPIVLREESPPEEEAVMEQEQLEGKEPERDTEKETTEKETEMETEMETDQFSDKVAENEKEIEMGPMKDREEDVTDTSNESGEDKKDEDENENEDEEKEGEEEEEEEEGHAPSKGEFVDSNAVSSTSGDSGPSKIISETLLSETLPAFTRRKAAAAATSKIEQLAKLPLNYIFKAAIRSPQTSQAPRTAQSSRRTTQKVHRSSSGGGKAKSDPEPVDVDPGSRFYIIRKVVIGNSCVALPPGSSHPHSISPSIP